MWQEKNRTDNNIKDKIGIKKLKSEKVRGKEDDRFKSAGGSSD